MTLHFFEEKLLQHLVFLCSTILRRNKYTELVELPVFSHSPIFISELLERVLFRLGTSDTDEQLENAVIKFLAPVILKITSPNETVRCKVRF